MTDAPTSSPTAAPAAGGDGAPATAGRAAAWGLVLGPVAFVVGWVVCGATIDGFSPVRYAISDLAGVGSPRRWPMTAALVAYGLALVVGAAALRRVGARGAALAALVNGVATLGVAATPVHGSDTVDGLHGIAAFVAYVSLAALPLAAARPLARAGHRNGAVASVAVGVATALAFAAANGNDRTGLFQRTGTTLGNTWTVLAGLAVLTGAWAASRPASAP
ncbi:MAG TPA: DUF998 domain-containing protein [Aquihabitans sp.]|nr:DUF998 domain-containing protein [Aquihabitans sp.]